LTPTSASWWNLTEGWFSVLTRKALINASFTSTRQLEDAIDVWASRWNHDPQPFVWTKTGNDIITKVKRGRATLDRVLESATHHWEDLLVPGSVFRVPNQSGCSGYPLIDCSQTPAR
jgi:hypothetical protein